MIKIYVLQIKQTNVLLKASLQKKSIIEWAKRFLIHHSSNELVCTVWNWGSKVEEFSIKGFTK